MKIAVAGATGMVGKQVVRIADGRGHTVIPLSRATGVDLVSGNGLAAALRGADVVIDVVSTETTSTAVSVAFFRDSSTNLLAAEKEAGIPHHLALSIVGIDGAGSGYYAGKLEQERIVTAGQVPWTILRATQFHEFAAQMVGRTSLGPFAFVPVTTTQPIAATEVAAALVEFAEGQPRGRVADLGGPRREDLVDMVRRYLRSAGIRRAVIPLRLPGSTFRAMRDGSILPGPEATLGTQTFTQWLETVPRQG
jgi:uncharacterized protein YbjT (DUF2867 family)